MKEKTPIKESLFNLIGSQWQPWQAKAEKFAPFGDMDKPRPIIDIDCIHFWKTPEHHHNFRDV